MNNSFYLYGVAMGSKTHGETSLVQKTCLAKLYIKFQINIVSLACETII